MAPSSTSPAAISASAMGSSDSRASEMPAPTARTMPTSTMASMIHGSGIGLRHARSSAGGSIPAARSSGRISCNCANGATAWLEEPALSRARLSNLSEYQPKQRRIRRVPTRAACTLCTGSVTSERLKSPRRRRKPRGVRSSKKLYSRANVRATPVTLPSAITPRRPPNAASVCTVRPECSIHSRWPANIAAQLPHSQISNGSRKSNCCAAPSNTAKTTSENSNRPKVRIRPSSMENSIRPPSSSRGESARPVSGTAAFSRRSRTSRRRRSASVAET